jgi:hypothetical protein
LIKVDHADFFAEMINLFLKASAFFQFNLFQMTGGIYPRLFRLFWLMRRRLDSRLSTIDDGVLEDTLESVMMLTE